MSGSAEIRVVADAQDVDALAAEFLVRRHNRNGWTASDETEFAEWISLSLAHKAAYWRLEAVWQRADRLSALRSTQSAESEAKPVLRGILTRWGIIAATIVVAAMVVGFQFFIHMPRTTAYSTPVGGHLNVALADGSLIELNTDTFLHATMSDRQRAVTLDRGEAYFQIKHDGAVPFYVVAAGHRVVDLGTKFLVRRDAGRVEVALVEGRACIESAASSRPCKIAVLKPGDFAVIANNSVSVSRKDNQDLTDRLGWRRGVLVFNHMALADAAAEFNRYNNRKLVVVGPSIEKLEIVGIFPVHDTDLFGRAVKTVLGLNVERRGEEVLISR